MREITKRLESSWRTWRTVLNQQSSLVMTKLDCTWRTISNHPSSRGLTTKFNSCKSRNLQKAVYNARITILCGIITILVLRGTVGTSGIFGSSSSTPSIPERRLLMNYEKETEDREKMEIDEGPVIDPSVPFQLGDVNITNWDEQRAAWLLNHPNITKNKFGKDRVLLVSGSAPKPCRNAIGDHMLVKSLKNKIDYTRFVWFLCFNLVYFIQPGSALNGLIAPRHSKHAGV